MITILLSEAAASFDSSGFSSAIGFAKMLIYVATYRRIYLFGCRRSGSKYSNVFRHCCLFIRRSLTNWISILMVWITTRSSGSYRTLSVSGMILAATFY